MSCGTRQGPALSEKRAVNWARRIAPASDDGRSCGWREPVERPVRAEELVKKGDWPKDDDRSEDGKAIANIDGGGNRGLTGADTLAIVLLGRGLIVVVPGFLDRPRRLLRAGMGRVHRPPGQGRRGEQQHQGCQAGPEGAENHSVNLVTWRGGGKDSTQGYRVTQGEARWGKVGQGGQGGARLKLRGRR